MKRKIDLRSIVVFFLTGAFVLAPVSVLGAEKSTDRLQSVRTSLKEEQAKRLNELKSKRLQDLRQSKLNNELKKECYNEI